jgi:hypothetical protein
VEEEEEEEMAERKRMVAGWLTGWLVLQQQRKGKGKGKEGERGRWRAGETRLPFLSPPLGCQ